MKACWADEVEVPGYCVWDTYETHNCIYASRGITKHSCKFWNESNTVTLIKELLSDPRN